MSIGKHNIQKKSEMYRWLKDQGYSWLRTTKHHIWSNGKHSVAIPSGNGHKINPIVATKIVKEVEDFKRSIHGISSQTDRSHYPETPREKRNDSVGAS